MWEQAGILEDVADAPLLHRHVDSPLAVEQDGVIQPDMSGIRPAEPGDGVDDGAFARSAAAEQGGDTLGRRLEGDIEIERSLASANGDVQHSQIPHARHLRDSISRPASQGRPIIQRTRRPSHSDKISALSDRVKDSATSRAASTSPSGVWVAV